MSQQKSPSQGSSTVEERIAIRRARIKNRLESKNNKKYLSEITLPRKTLTAEGDGFEGTYFKRVYFDGTELLTNIFVALVDKERKRRRKEEIRREETQKRLEAVSITAKRQLQESVQRWNAKKVKLPLSVYRLMENERNCLENILKLKEDEISNLRQLLMETEQSYQKNLESFRSDILRMVDISQSLLDDLSRISSEEIQSLALELQEKSQKEASRNMEKMKERCQEYIKNGSEQDKSLEKQQKESQTNLLLEEMEQKEQCGDQRRNYQNEIHELGKEMRRVVTSALFNEEKIDYNIQVLKKRQNEWRQATSKQTVRLERLNKRLNYLKKQLESIEHTRKTEHTSLKEECEHLKRDIESLKERISQFTKVQRKKNVDIYEVRMKEIKHLSCKICQADKIIHEQILNVPWDGLDTEFLKHHPLVTMSPPHESVDRNILNACCNEVGFISEERFLENLKPLWKSYSPLIKPTDIFKLFDILNKNDIEEIFGYLQHYSASDVGDEIRVTPNQAFNAFKKFLENHHLSPILPLHESSNIIIDIKYWEQCYRLLPKGRDALWDAIQDIQKKHFDNLKRRAGLLKQKNEILQENNNLELAIKKASSVGLSSLG